MAPSSRSTSPSTFNDRRGQFAPGGRTITRRPSYLDLGDEDEDFVDENDEQAAGAYEPIGSPQTDLMSRLANRGAPSRSPPRYDMPAPGIPWASPVRQAGTARGPSVRAAVSKFQYLADASASTPNFVLPKPSAPIPIPRNRNRPEIGSSGLGLALSAPAGGSVIDLRESSSLKSHNPHLKLVNGELRMTVFPERKGRVAATSGQQFVPIEQSQPITRPAPPRTSMETEDSTDYPPEQQSRTSSPRPKIARPPLPNPVDIAALRSRPSVPKSSPVSASRTTEKPLPEVHARAEAPGERPKSFVSVIPRNHVANIVGELKFTPTSPSGADNIVINEKKTSKWAPVDTSTTLKRKWEPGSRLPATIRSYMQFFSGQTMTKVK